MPRAGRSRAVRSASPTRAAHAAPAALRGFPRPSAPRADPTAREASVALQSPGSPGDPGDADHRRPPVWHLSGGIDPEGSEKPQVLDVDPERGALLGGPLFLSPRA